MFRTCNFPVHNDIKSENHKIVEVGRDLLRLSGQTPNLQLFLDY